MKEDKKNSEPKNDSLPHLYNWVEYAIDVHNILKIPDNEFIGEQYWYFVHKVVQRVKADLLTLAALEIHIFLPNDVSYKRFLEDCKKHNEWEFSTTKLTKIRQKIKSERSNVTAIIIEDIIKMQIEMGYPIEDEVIKYDQNGKKIGLSRKPSTRKLKMLGKQLGLGELFIIYQTTVYTYRDFCHASGTDGPIKFKKNKMRDAQKLFDLGHVKDPKGSSISFKDKKLKNTLLEHLTFNDALIRFWEIIDYDEPLFASTLVYLVNLYINDKSWWFWRDEYTYILSTLKNHSARKLHLITLGNICEAIICQIEQTATKHIIKENKELYRIVDDFRKKEFASLSSYMKSKYFKF